MKLSRFLLALIIGLCGIQPFAEADDPVDNPPWRPIGRYTYEPIRESSGVVASRQFDGVYWTLNDSGNPAVLYATTMIGKLIREFPVQGAKNSDWEALAIDDKGRLWVGEIGNNSRMRDDLTVFVVPEPNPFKDTEATAIAYYPYRYPAENVDAEGLFIIDGFPYIVSKEQERAVLYRFTALETDKPHLLKRVGELVDAKVVTGADLSADGRRLVVCTYDALWVYHDELKNIARMIQNRPWKVTHDIRGEAVVFNGYDLVLTTEARDIYRVPQWWYEQELPMPPGDAQSAVSLLEPTPTKVESGLLITEPYAEAGIPIGGRQVGLIADGKGAKITQTIEVPRADQYEIRAVLTHGPEYAQVALVVSGKWIGQPHDCYAPKPVAGSVVTFGTTALKAGKNEITLQVAGKSSDASGYKIGIDSYVVRPGSAFATRYLVLGPLPRPTDSGKTTPPPLPKKNLNLKATFTGLGGKQIGWKPAEADTDGRLDLLTHIAQVENAVGYALTYVHSETARDAVLLVGSDDGVTVWLNGVEVHRYAWGRWANPDTDAVPCRLKAGWNTVLCKINQSMSNWALYLRFTDPEGKLRYSSEPSGEASRK
jgi:hypothetical protein